MLFLVSGPQGWEDVPNVGWFTNPVSRNSIEWMATSGRPWAADNGCFTCLDREAFMRLLMRVRGKPNLLFVVAPDVVADAKATLKRFEIWEPAMHYLGLPVAFVGQDGQEDLPVPWGRFEAFFVGGSTEWKLGRAAVALVQEAKAREKWVHMGRVNSIKRITYAANIGCDSVDGWQWSAFRDAYRPLAIKALTARQYGFRELLL
jgi:hypothetical protein